MISENFTFDFRSSGKQFYCHIKASGKLTHEDYERFIPEFEKELSHIKDSKVKIVVDITELKGWELKAVLG